MKLLFKILVICLLPLSLQLASGATALSQKEVDFVRKAIVTINARVSVAAYISPGEWSGTGFIVDKEKGLVVTNTHVVGRSSVGTYFATFDNGKQAEAKLIYFDPYADFAVMKVEPKDLPADSTQIDFAKDESNLGDEVFIVGNTEGQGFSFHSGYLSDKYEVSGALPQASLIINMNAAGGASGSPLINKQNQAVGVIYARGQTHAIALRKAYVEHALAAIKLGSQPQRQHIGAICGLYSLDKASKHRSFPHDISEKYINKYPASRNRAIVVKAILPGSPAAGQLKPGDIIWQINDKKLGPDLTIFDQAMNEAKSEVRLVLYRDGKKLAKTIKPYDLNVRKVTKMVDLAGAMFFEADDFFSYNTGIALGRVSIANVLSGSSFSAIYEKFREEFKSLYRLQVLSLAGRDITSLDALQQNANEILANKHINIRYLNYQPYYAPFRSPIGFNSWQTELTEDITFDSIDTKPRILEFNQDKLEWESNQL